MNRTYAIAGLGCVLALLAPARAQTPAEGQAPVAQATQSGQRILGVIPNFQTVSDPNAPFVPLSARQKWNLFLRETFDPFNAASAAFGAALSQSSNETPKYGRGPRAYAERFGAAFADFGSQNLFSAAVFANLLHQDPRYFRMGPRAGVMKRARYSISRVVVTRQDSGRQAFNFSGILGIGAGIATSNLYYPSSSIRGEVMAGRIWTSMLGGAMGNLLAEFWPDLRSRVLHRK